MYTVSRNGRLNVWECDSQLSDLVERTINEDEDDEDVEIEDEKRKNLKINEEIINDDDSIKKIGIKYRKKAK